MSEALDSDRAVITNAADEFGFVGIAESLAPRIAEASQGDGLVIGLEGSWGSGKSSLMNLIRHQIDSLDNSNIHTITIAPWLDGDSSSLVLSMLHPIAEILKKESENSKTEDIKEKAAELAKLVAGYGERTARWISPVAKLAGNVLPGAGISSGVADSAATVLAKFNEGPTVSELKAQISEQIEEIDHSFIIFLDDLDRLEPEQAVEVVRLVRSVADFPKVVYLMCYDRKVLANGLKVGLKVEDGDLFLQKIVQLTFQIPRLEPFELRQQFLKAAKLIYEDVHQKPLTGEMLGDLKGAVDTAGANLLTPREVKLTLNAIRFSYPSIADNVYFPDMCWMHLIKTKRYKLYQWLEEYLSVRSVVATGDGSISKDSRAEFGKRLDELLPSEDYSSSDSLYHVGQYIPGVSYYSRIYENEGPEKSVFTGVSKDDEREAMLNKRIASLAHYRYYFALTGPKTVMSDDELNEALQIAKHDADALSQRLRNYAETERVYKLEQLRFRLESELDAITDIEIIEELIKGLTDVMDIAMKNQNDDLTFNLSFNHSMVRFIEKYLKKIRESNNNRKFAMGLWMVQEGKALNWLVGMFLRSQLFDHGRVGDEAKNSEEWVFTEEELDQIVEAMIIRISSRDVQDQIKEMPKLDSYLYGWKNLSNDDGEAQSWVLEFCQSDQGFLQLLRSLRHRIISDRVYYSLPEKTVSRFLDWDETQTRLVSMQEGEHAEEAQDLIQAIELSRHY